MGADPNLMQIIASVQNDIKNLRAHLDNIPTLSKGKIYIGDSSVLDQRPPSPIARFQNNLEKIEQSLAGGNNKVQGSFGRANSANIGKSSLPNPNDYKLPDIGMPFKT